MTEEIYAESLSKILQNKKQIEKEFNIKITNRGGLLFIESAEPLSEYDAIRAIEAMNLGFSFEKACLLKDENFCFEKIKIKDISKRKNLKEVRGRIIGTHRKNLDILENMTDCSICLHNNTIGIIARTEDISNIKQALTKLIQGAKHSNVYAQLEKRMNQK